MKKSKPQKLGEIIESVLSERGYLKASREAEIIPQWPKIVGERIAQATECTEVKEGVLYVRVSSASWRNELSFFKEKIIGMIRAQTKCGTIRDIVFY